MAFSRIGTRPPRKDRIFIPKCGIALSGRFRLLGAFKMLFVQPSVGCGEEVSAAGYIEHLCPPCAPRRRKRRRRRMRRVEEEGEEEDEDRVATCLHSH